MLYPSHVHELPEITTRNESRFSIPVSCLPAHYLRDPLFMHGHKAVACAWPAGVEMNGRPRSVGRIQAGESWPCIEMTRSDNGRE